MRYLIVIAGKDVSNWSTEQQRYWDQIYAIEIPKLKFKSSREEIKQLATKAVLEIEITKQEILENDPKANIKVFIQADACLRAEMTGAIGADIQMFPVYHIEENNRKFKFWR